MIGESLISITVNQVEEVLETVLREMPNLYAKSCRGTFNLIVINTILNSRNKNKLLLL